MLSAKKIINELDILNYIGNIELTIKDAVPLDVNNQRSDVLMWVSAQNSHLVENILNGVIICSFTDDYEYPVNENLLYLFSNKPRQLFQKVLLNYFYSKNSKLISVGSIIADNVRISEDIILGCNVIIEADCIIGENVIIDHNTVIKSGTIIGNNVKIGSNCCIGGVGFGYEKNDLGNYEFIPHLGNVIIKDNVEIGNNTCIDRAVLGSTILNSNVKVDNLVHIAHGVIIGKNSLIIANSMIAGSVTIGDNCWIAPSVSILNKKDIGDNVIVGISSLITKNISSNQTVMGIPAEEISFVLKNKEILRKILTNFDN